MAKYNIQFVIFIEIRSQIKGFFNLNHYAWVDRCPTQHMWIGLESLKKTKHKNNKFIKIPTQITTNL